MLASSLSATFNFASLTSLLACSIVLSVFHIFPIALAGTHSNHFMKLKSDISTKGFVGNIYEKVQVDENHSYDLNFTLAQISGFITFQ
jgi:hypothetical protein